MFVFSSGRSLESIHITWTQFAQCIFVICLNPHFSAFTAERLTCIFRARSQQWKLPVWVWSSRGRWKHGRQQWRGPCPISGRWGNRVSAMLWSHTHTSKHKLWISSQDGEAQAHTWTPQYIVSLQHELSYSKSIIALRILSANPPQFMNSTIPHDYIPL